MKNSILINILFLSCATTLNTNHYHYIAKPSKTEDVIKANEFMCLNDLGQGNIEKAYMLIMKNSNKKKGIKDFSIRAHNEYRLFFVCYEVSGEIDVTKE
ncbi:hypothetical protein EHQ92_12770 [Leptospira biflexa]|uniref:hypothetical protein n=1 Tax=Leptospira biflexa TaxID=172 RepID=UPI0010916D87|nr:hypothetical protein [Leptospira biflexa]TGM42891.1 hypothetical protein EHQ88_18180 [Leptospira biflexa]TGM45128.1 hypothetical protein EHQ92_12770 [Leptospira biflexa]